MTPHHTRRAALFVVALAFFTDMFLYYVLVPMLPAYAKRLGMNQMESGILFGSYAVSLLFGTFPLGRIVDRAGRRKPMLWGLAGLGATTLLFAVSNSYPLLVLARLLQGFSAAATWVTGLALLADYFPAQERGRAMGTAFAFGNFGVLIAPPVSGLVIEHMGPRAPFFLASALALLDALARAFLLRDPEGTQSIQPWSLRQVLSNRTILSYCGLMVLGASMWGLLESTLPLDFDARLSATPSQIGGYFAAAAGLHMLTSPLMGRLSDRIGRKRVVTIGLLLAPFLFPLPALVSPGGPLTLVMMGFGLLTSFVMSPASPALADAVEREGSRSFGSVFALFNVAYAAGMMAGPFAGSALTQVFGLKTALASFGILFGAYILIIKKA